MRVIVQRVSNANCKVDGNITGEINNGYMLLVGFGLSDGNAVVEKMAEKVSKLRIFEDEQGKINKSIFDVNGKILSISQFTLYGDVKKGNRPTYINAMRGEESKILYDKFNELLKEEVPVETGIFGADMKVELLNDGPTTIIIEK